MRRKIWIQKASGQEQLFSKEKLKKSLLRAKAGQVLADEVADAVEAKLREGMSTREIYDLAYGLLRRKRKSYAARYGLKRAIMEMGPSGFPFERFVAELFRARGYSVSVGEVVDGRCVRHEVDVVASKDGERMMIECKFHNQPGLKSDVKVALYVKARFDDVCQKDEMMQAANPFTQACLVTNTELTADAVQYAQCAGILALGWAYPGGKGLASWVEESKLHPVTCLSSLSQAQKKYLMENGVVLAKDVPMHETLLDEAGVREEREAVLSEVRFLCGQGEVL